MINRRTELMMFNLLAKHTVAAIGHILESFLLIRAHEIKSCGHKLIFEQEIKFVAMEYIIINNSTSI